jgi:hypothetical protein
MKVKIKLKVKLSLCLTKHYAMKTYWEWRYSSRRSLTWALAKGKWSASRLCRFTHREEIPSTNWIGDWVGPRTGLDGHEICSVPLGKNIN